MLEVPLIKKDKKIHDDHFNPSLRVAHSKSLPVLPTLIPKRTNNLLTEDEHLTTSFTNCRDEQPGHVLGKCNILTMKYFSRRQKWGRKLSHPKSYEPHGNNLYMEPPSPPSQTRATISRRANNAGGTGEGNPFFGQSTFFIWSGVSFRCSNSNFYQ